MKWLAILILTSLITSCLKEELPIVAHQSGDVETASVSMESDYKWQVYFDLEANEVVGQNPKTSWDIGFSCCSSDNRVVINDSKAMFVFPTAETNYAMVTDTVGYSSNKRYDVPSGNLDSTAIGDWQVGEVFIIDRGYTPEGIALGFYKLQINASDNQSYTIRYGELSDQTGDLYVVERDSIYNFTFFNLEQGTVVDVEPPRSDWDLVFTQYIHVFHEPQPTPYLVTGCLLNRYDTKALKVTAYTFDEIDLEIAQNLVLQPNMNEIGYNWKTFANGSYEINSENTYVIQDQHGLFYKLRFIDFYDEQGAKGTPTFEFQYL